MVTKPFHIAISISNIQSGFRKCGIWPFDPNVIEKCTLKGVSADDDLSIPHVSNEDISVEEGEVGDIGMIELP